MISSKKEVNTKKIILHTGLPKTATSSIQNNLFENKSAMLTEDKVLYLSIAANHSTPIGTIFRKNPANLSLLKMAKVSSKKEIIKLQESTLKSIQAELDSSKWHTLIISAEGISNFDTEESIKLYTWLKGISNNIQVITFTRNPVAYTTSVSQQFIKTGSTLKELAISPPLPRHRKRLSNLIKTFGKESMTVIPYENSLTHEHGILGVFFEACKYKTKTTAAILQNQTRSNESMSMQAAQIWSDLNEARPLFKGSKPGLNRTFKEALHLMKIKGDKFSLSESICNEVFSASLTDSQWLLKEFSINYTEKNTTPTRNTETLNGATSQSLALLISDLLNQIKTLQSRK